MNVNKTHITKFFKTFHVKGCLLVLSLNLLSLNVSAGSLPPPLRLSVKLVSSTGVVDFSKTIIPGGLIKAPAYNNDNYEMKMTGLQATDTCKLIRPDLTIAGDCQGFNNKVMTGPYGEVQEGLWQIEIKRGKYQIDMDVFVRH